MTPQRYRLLMECPNARLLEHERENMIPCDRCRETQRCPFDAAPLGTLERRARALVDGMRQA